MPVKLKKFDAADFLHDEEDIALYLEEVASENDPQAFAKALGTIARARNMSQLARDAGLTRVGLTKALGPEGNPSFATVVKIARALGFELVLAPQRSVAQAEGAKISRTAKLPAARTAAAKMLSDAEHGAERGIPPKRKRSEQLPAFRHRIAEN